MRKVLTYLAALLFAAPLFAQGEVSFLDAVQSYSDGAYEKALSEFRILHARDTTDDAVLYYLGMCEFSAGDVKQAEEHLGKAVAIDSTNTWYLNSLASLYTATGRAGLSAVLCEKLVKLSSSFRTPYTLTMIADRKMAEMDDDSALEYYEQALELDPDYAPAEIGKGDIMRMRGNFPSFFLSLGRFVHNEEVMPEAKSDYLQQILQRMDSRFYWVWGGQLQTLVDDCVEMHPEDVQSRINKLNLAFIQQDTVEVYRQCEAIVPLATAARDTTNLLMALEVMGDMYHAQGRNELSYKYYEQALAVDPDCCAVLNNYAYFLSLEKKKLRKAAAMSLRSIEIEPDNATYLDTYGWILYLQKKPQKAKPYFKHAMIYGGKDSSVILEHYSIVLEALGEKDLSIYYKSLSDQKK